jgi:hypothetical protein
VSSVGVVEPLTRKGVMVVEFVDFDVGDDGKCG